MHESVSECQRKYLSYAKCGRWYFKVGVGDKAKDNIKATNLIELGVKLRCSLSEVCDTSGSEAKLIRILSRGEIYLCKDGGAEISS